MWQEWNGVVEGEGTEDMSESGKKEGRRRIKGDGETKCSEWNRNRGRGGRKNRDGCKKWGYVREGKRQKQEHYEGERKYVKGKQNVR